ncbi:iron uptake system protein EfeO [Planosporangium flavigriseum]|uniref:Lipoprotein n=1 Tax=Planosporangium flavigriseum TaxID=373681 RepID=A0A8J3LGB2_9ACTN|nr:iron uptake system protein EfeO [Planosporangium flavigriseum]NJC64943.1 iron uptake system protein EfeO [Planosporangium flavigriseum]GIG72818.1 lipoprotein [Planosporangium flavigriseum]
MRSHRLPACVTLGALALTGLAACGQQTAKTEKIAVTASDTACEVARTELPAGAHTFSVTNKGSKVTEFYVYAKDGSIKGEVENIGPGTTRDVHVELVAGEYESACKPGMKGDGIRGKLTVTGQATALTSDPKLAAAVAAYKAYVSGEADGLLAKTTEFAAAVKAGDVAKAKELYPVARTHWERIEPVAESFGDLDPAIDARENDVEAGQEWTGFHKIEKDLWTTGDVSGDARVADKLVADVTEIVRRAKTVDLSPVQLAAGSKELLDEVATGKITGEEDRYSHTDLWDFAANLEGAKAAIDALRDALAERDSGLLTALDAKFATVQAALDKHKAGTGWKPYTELSTADTKELSNVINGLAEPISKVAAVVAR